MKLLVLLPHVDPTLRPLAPDGWTLVDAAEPFARRMASPQALQGMAEGLLRQTDPESLRRALLLRAAASMLQRAPRTATHARLRALGAAFTGASTGRLQLRLDDLELHDGSTERGADLISSASEPLPFSDELTMATETAKEATVVRLWIDRDQQLPAAVAFARALPGELPLELDGPFVHRHAEALQKLFSRATIVAAGLRLEQRLRGVQAQAARASATLWREDGAADVPRGTWAGHVTVAELESLSPSGCRAATVALCAVGPEEVLGADGSRVPLERFRNRLQRWAGSGTSLFIEWWIGAPGESARSHLATLAAFDAESLKPAKLMGLRPFHWSRHRKPSLFAGREVTFGVPDADRDLARSIPFECADSLSPEERSSLIEQLAASAAERHPLVPGRVALAYVVEAEKDAPRGPRVRMAHDAAVVSLPSSLDGKPQQTWYAVQLRKRTTMVMDPRLAPQLAALTDARPPADVLPQLSAALREKVVRQLADKRILEEVEV